MKYRVVWSPHAEHQLEAILADTVASSGLARCSAINVDDYLMQIRGFGESRYEENMRIGFDLPLGVEYEILEDVRTVIVHGAWRIEVR